MEGLNNIFQRALKLMQRINELAACSAETNHLVRVYGTECFVEAGNRLRQWMSESSLETYVDNIGNVRGRLRCGKKDPKVFVIGSHFDTVVNAGKYDGPLGILIGLDMIEQLKKSNLKPDFDIELVAFCDEEGVRFKTAYLGSKVLAGVFDKNLLERKDESETSLKEVIRSMGGDIEKLGDDGILQKDWLGYFEVHIEQGPVLFAKDIPVGVVSSIAGQKRAEIIFTGVAGHAGTVPMDMRNDALACAAEFISATEKFALAHKNRMVATVGKIHVTNEAANVIAGKVTCSLDTRSSSGKILSDAYQQIVQICETICSKRNIEVEWKLLQSAEPVQCDDRLTGLLENAIAQNGLEVVRLVSGAGHDAVPISAVAPVAMLFVRCIEGISHNPLENVEIKDVEGAIKVCDFFIENLLKHHNGQNTQVVENKA